MTKLRRILESEKDKTYNSEGLKINVKQSYFHLFFYTNMQVLFL
jgi:hypothetical protein